MVCVTSSPLEDKILEALAPSFGVLGYLIVRIQVRGNERATLEILIERTDGTPVTLDDCVKASHQASAILDVEDPLEKAYSLEVFSPGLERPLTRDEDFDTYKGQKIRIKTDVAFDQRKRFSGVLVDVTEEDIALKLDDREEPVRIAKAHIAQAHLCPELDDFNMETTN